MEVIAWPDTYGETRDLWEEGSFLWIVGKVRQREGETSIHCEEVKPFQLDGMESEKPTAAPPAPIPAPPVYPQQMLLISLMETGNADEDVFLATA
jgi:hypothetical protein